MPESVYDKYNGSSSEEEEESDEEVVLPRRTSQFRVASNATEVKAAVLNEIRDMAPQQQQNEVVVTEQRIVEKTEEEKRALEERQQMLKQQEAARAQQAAALQQAAAARAAAAAAPPAAGDNHTKEEEYARQMEEEMRRKAEAARAQAEAERKAAEERQAQMKAQQEAALRAAEEQTRKAQEEALRKVQQAKAEAEAKAKKEAEEKAKAAAQAKALADAQAKAAQAKAQAEAQARKAQEEAKAKAAQAKAQAEAQAKKAQAEALEKARKAQIEAQERAKAQQAQQKAAAPQPKAPAKPAAAPAAPKAAPPPPAKPAPAAPAPKIKPKPDPVPLKTNEPIKAPQRTPGKVAAEMPQFKQYEPRVIDLPKDSTLKQTAKLQEEMLAQDVPRFVKGVHAQKPGLKLDNVREKFIEKEEPVPEKQKVKNTGVLAGASRWEEESAAREQAANQMGTDGPAPLAVRLQDDACWQTQHRVPPEVQPPQIGKISIPEFNDLHEVHKTVIVNKPQSYQKPKWNEFPEEVTPEIGAAPKVHTQEWNPVNQENTELQRSVYRPGKISHNWPPPERGVPKMTVEIRPVKPGDDAGWIQQEQNEVVKSTGWQRDSKIDRVWPPPEGETITTVYSGPQHMRPVQWPPAESEEHAQQQVEVLQKHIPAKKMEYQWPPPPPVYQGDSETNGFIVNGDVPTGDQQQIGKTTTTTTTTTTRKVAPPPPVKQHTVRVK
ncbi:hypothetical protein V3C99_015067 [Haemonchus contortus]